MPTDNKILASEEEKFQVWCVKSRIDEFARMRGLRMDELAEASGLSVVTIRKARRDGPDGIDTLTLKNLQKIARALDLRPKDLFFDD